MFSLRTKLVLAFLVVGILPVLAAMWIAAETASQMLEKEVRVRLEKGLAEAQNYIGELKERAYITSYLSLNEKKFYLIPSSAGAELMKEFKRERGTDFLMVLKDGDILGDRDVSILRDIRGGGKDLCWVQSRGKTLPAICGWCSNGTYKSVSGTFLGVSLLESLEGMTGMEVSFVLPDGRKWGVPDNISEKETKKLMKYMKRVRHKRKPRFVDGLHLGGDKYMCLFTPLFNSRGDFLAMMGLNISERQAFEGLMVATRFFYFIIALGAIFSILLGYWVSERISKPINRFATIAEAVARGDFEQGIPIRERRDEVGKLARSFEKMKKDLKELQRRERLASLGEFSAGLAHEIRNPLSIIKNAAEGLLSKGRGEEDRKRLLSIIVEETRRLNRLVTDFLSFARPTPSNLVEGDLGEMVEDLLDSFRPQLGKGIELAFRSQGDIKAFYDPDKLRQALLNILINARDALIDIGGNIGVELSEEGTEVVLQISDNGPGIPQEIKDKIFDPFFTTREKGTGLGLAVAHRIIEEHRGNMMIISREGQGTTVEVRLPGGMKDG